MNFFHLIFLASFAVFSYTLFQIMGETKERNEPEYEGAWWSASMAAGFVPLNWFLELYWFHQHRYGWSFKLILNLFQIPLVLVSGIIIASE